MVFALLAAARQKAGSVAGRQRGDYIPLPDGTMLFCTYFKHISASTFYANGKKAAV